MMLNLLGQATDKYSGGQHKTDVSGSVVPGDLAINALWVDYTAPRALTDTWVFKRRVIKEAFRLLGDGHWLTDVDQNAYLHGSNYDFLVDTLRFILTGRRRLPVSMWAELVTQESLAPIDVDYRATVKTLLREYPHVTKDTCGLIQQWCSQPKGVDDMVCSLNLLFGDLHQR